MFSYGAVWVDTPGVHLAEMVAEEPTLKIMKIINTVSEYGSHSHTGKTVKKKRIRGQIHFWGRK